MLLPVCFNKTVTQFCAKGVLCGTKTLILTLNLPFKSGFSPIPQRARQDYRLHIGIIRPIATLRSHPGDILTGVFYVTRLTVYAILEIDHKARVFVPFSCTTS